MSGSNELFNNLPLHGYDVVMLLVLAAATIAGIWKGFAWQVASIASLVASFAVAVRFADYLAPRIRAEPPWNKFAAMLILYLATSLAIWLVFQLVAKAIDKIKLKDFDRQLGGLFGLAKGIIYCIVITFFVVTLSPAARQSVLHSRSGYYIAVLIDRATPVMPSEVRQVLDPYLHRLEEQLDPATTPEAPPEAQPEGIAHQVT